MGKKTIYGIRRNCRVAAQVMAEFPRVGYATLQPYTFKENELYYVYVTFFKTQKPVAWVCREKEANFADANIESFARLWRHGEVMWCDLRVDLQDEDPDNSGVYLVRFYMDRKFRVIGLKRQIRETPILDLPFRSVCNHQSLDYYFVNFEATVLNKIHVPCVGGKVKLLTGQELMPIMGMMSYMAYQFCEHAEWCEAVERQKSGTCSEDPEYDERLLSREPSWWPWLETRLLWIERDPPRVVPQLGTPTESQEVDYADDVPF